MSGVPWKGCRATSRVVRNALTRLPKPSEFRNRDDDAHTLVIGVQHSDPDRADTARRVSQEWLVVARPVVAAVRRSTNRQPDTLCARCRCRCGPDGLRRI
eukprot:3155597-Prymnesium_polylepis.1